MHGLLPKSDEWDASSTSLRSWRRNSFELLRYPWRQSTLSLFSPLSWSLLGDAFLRMNSPLLETADAIRPPRGPNDGKAKDSLWGTQHMRSNRSTLSPLAARDAPTTLIMILLRLLEVGRRSGSRPEEGRLIRAGNWSAWQMIASQLFVIQALYICTVLSIDNAVNAPYNFFIFYFTSAGTATRSRQNIKFLQFLLPRNVFSGTIFIFSLVFNLQIFTWASQSLNRRN